MHSQLERLAMDVENDERLPSFQRAALLAGYWRRMLRIARNAIEMDRRALDKEET